MPLVDPGTTSYKAIISLQDPVSLQPLLGKVAANLTASYYRAGDAAVTSISLTDATALNDAYSSGKIKEVNASSQPGDYLLHVPNGVIAAGLTEAMVKITDGAGNLYGELPFEAAAAGTGGGGSGDTTVVMNPVTTWNVLRGRKSNRLRVFFSDPVTGEALTGLAFDTLGLTCGRVRGGSDSGAIIALIEGTGLNNPYLSNSFQEVNSTDEPGWYRFDPSDATMAFTDSNIIYTWYLDVAGTVYAIGRMEIMLEDCLYVGTLQSAPLANTAVLDAGASSTNDIFKNGIIEVLEGTARGASATVGSYVGSTKTVTITDNWEIQPDATSLVVIRAAAAGGAAGVGTDSPGVTTLLARIGAFSGTGNNTLLGFMRALLRSDAGILPTDIGGVYDNTLASLQALRNRGDSTWVPPATVTVDPTGLDQVRLPDLDLLIDALCDIRAGICGDSAGTGGSPETFKDREGNARLTAVYDGSNNRIVTRN